MSRMRAELQPGQIEDRERGQGLPRGIGGVLGQGQLDGVAEDLIEHHHRLGVLVRMTLRGVAVVTGKFPADMRPGRFLTW
jgi:hypothetical protein